MGHFIEWLHVFILNYSSFQYLIIFVLAAFGGEVAIFILAFLAAQGVLPFFPLIVLSFLGVLSSDVLWFYLGKTVFVDRIISHRYTSPTISIITQAVDHISNGSRFITLILAKFIVGARMILIMYISRTNLELKRFIRYDIVAVFVWLLVVAPTGYVSGLGFTYLSEIFHSLYIDIGLILLIILVLVVTQIWFRKILIKKA